MEALQEAEVAVEPSETRNEGRLKMEKKNGRERSIRIQQMARHSHQHLIKSRKSRQNKSG